MLRRLSVNVARTLKPRHSTHGERRPAAVLDASDSDASQPEKELPSPTSDVNKTMYEPDGTEDMAAVHHSHNKLHIPEKALRSRYDWVDYHRTMTQQVDDTRVSLLRWRRLLYDLVEAYHVYRSACSCCYYGAMVDIVREKVEEYNHKDTDEGVSIYDESTKLISPIERLQLHAREFHETKAKRCQIEKYYSDASLDELKQSSKHLSAEHSFLCKQLHREELKLITLSARLRSLSLAPFWEKSSMLNAMIEEATSDCLTDSSSMVVLKKRWYKRRPKITRTISATKAIQFVE